MSFRTKLEGRGPRKLLAIDGGGIRGIVALEILAKIEAVLQNNSGKGGEFRLAHYFDYIAGTSTGAIIAAALSIGMSVDSVRELYLDAGREMFQKTSLIRRVWYRYNADPLSLMLKKVLGPDTTLGSERLETLLMIPLTNARGHFAWFVSNNPHAKFNDPSRPDSWSRLPLWQIVRASTAAPTYFPPEVLTPVPNQPDLNSVMLDGGITCNNPAFQLFLMATTTPYRLCWPCGQQDMLLVSVGTGTLPPHEMLRPSMSVWKMHFLHHTRMLATSFFYRDTVRTDVLCRIFGRCVAGDPVDRELMDLMDETGPVQPKLFTYCRYDLDIGSGIVNIPGLPNVDLYKICKLDSVRYLRELKIIGEAIADGISIKHFRGFL
jgi:predicted acylesterase/phospholipase RssA